MQHRAPRHGSYQVTTLIAGALLLLILFVSAGYLLILSEPRTAIRHEAAAARLATNRTLWKSRRPVEFRYVVERTCYCPVDYTRAYGVTETSTERDAYYDSPLRREDDRADETPPEPLWLDDIFNLVAGATTGADALTVTYDPGFGFPTYVAIDWSADAADDEQTLQVRDFEVLEYRR